MNKKGTEKQCAAFEAFLSIGYQYFLDQGLRVPVCANSGRGYHLLFAYPRIQVRECPDITERLSEFRGRFETAYRQELRNLEVRLDSTFELRRMVRIYGTAKPNVGVVSKFYGAERIEDEALRDYLLKLELSKPELKGSLLRYESELPTWFQGILDKDVQLRALWFGNGKPGGTDTSRSGFDYSIVRRLLWLGHRNIDDIATILALRPNGGVQGSGKGEAYVRRTIANALMK